MKKRKTGKSYLNKNNVIEFIDRSEYEISILEPLPAKKMLPEWYKKTQSFDFSDSEHDFPTMHNETIKKCVPVLDSLTAGYILRVPSDIRVDLDEDGSSYYTWRGQPEKITFHQTWQTKKYPADIAGSQMMPKFTNFYGIKTPPGYSTLFITPVHHDLPFHILEGVVDTDKFNHPVNFPFYLKDPSFTGIIEAGTPMAQAIPFKRESWSSELKVYRPDSDKFFEEIRNVSFRSVYRNYFWSRKEFN